MCRGKSGSSNVFVFDNEIDQFYETMSALLIMLHYGTVSEDTEVSLLIN